MSFSFFGIWAVATLAVFFGMGMHKRQEVEDDAFAEETNPLSPKRLFVNIVLASVIGLVVAGLGYYGMEQTLSER